MYTDLVFYMLMIACPQAELINESGRPWNDFDKKILRRAVRVCATDERYTDTPCLKKFYKRKEENAYAAICGAAKQRIW